MRGNREPFIAVAYQTTLANRTGTWRSQRPVYEAGISPCQSACPAQSNIPKWLGLIEQGKLQEAWELILEVSPFPLVCGYICPHTCEASCNRIRFDDTLSIRSLERYLGEEALRNHWHPSEVAISKDTKVAIVGSGPAGLTAAYYLAKQGHMVTVFETLAEPGGMMRYGIPNYRLPREVLAGEVDRIRNAGVRIKMNTRISSLDRLFQDGYDAVCLAIGAHQGAKLGIEGENELEIVEGITFLRAINMGNKVMVGNEVAIIGGGNVAIDASRSALRLGATEVTIIYRRTRTEMPASEEELDEAVDEGIKLELLAAPVRIKRENGKIELMCIRMELGAPDASGRKRPIPVKGSEFSLTFDTVITAIGQVPEDPDKFGLPLARGDTFQVDPDTLAAPIKGVFACGDDVTGPATVIEAIAAGKKAAYYIDRYLRSEPLATNGEASRVVEFEVLNLDYFEHQAKRPQIFDRLSAMAEAKRCFSCGYCNLCGNCFTFCPDVAIRREDDYYEINYDYCKGCGICVSECPTGSMLIIKE